MKNKGEFKMNKVYVIEEVSSWIDIGSTIIAICPTHMTAIQYLKSIGAKKYGRSAYKKEEVDECGTFHDEYTYHIKEHELWKG